MSPTVLSSRFHAELSGLDQSDPVSDYRFLQAGIAWAREGRRRMKDIEIPQGMRCESESFVLVQDLDGEKTDSWYSPIVS